MRFPVNAGSDVGPALPKESADVREGKETLAQEWAVANLPRIVEEAQDLAEFISDPDTSPEDRKLAQSERKQMLARIEAVARLMP